MRKRFFMVALVLSIAVAAMTLGPLSDRPGFGHPQLERFTAYLLLGAVWSLALPRRMLALGILIAAAAVGLELGQFMAPDRDPRLVDALAKVAGDIVGVGTIGFLDASFRQITGRSVGE